MNIHALIRNVPLFRQLNEGQLNKVAAGFRTLDVRFGEYLFRKGDSPEELFIIHSGAVEIIEHVGDESVCVVRLSETSFLGEATMLDGLVHTVSCRATSSASLAGWPRQTIDSFFDDDPAAARKVLAQVAQAIAHRLCTSNFAYRGGGTAVYVADRQRGEHDFLRERPIPAEGYFGVQTLRATENFRITGTPLSQYPNLIKAFAMVKKAAARANRALRMLGPDIADAISAACDEVIAGALGNQFVVDMIQGGAGTSTNMNVNKVIANRALENMGHDRGEYQFVHPNNHVNLSQSTTDTYPTAVCLAITSYSQCGC